MWVGVIIPHRTEDRVGKIVASEKFYMIQDSVCKVIQQDNIEFTLEDFQWTCENDKYFFYPKTHSMNDDFAWACVYQVSDCQFQSVGSLLS